MARGSRFRAGGAVNAIWPQVRPNTETPEPQVRRADNVEVIP